jgi:hypothetical protein
MAKSKVTSEPKENQEVVEITDLPFVKKRTGRMDKNCFWDVKPTGDYVKDCQTGATYGALALEFMKKDNFRAWLSWSAGCMPKDFSGIEVGFLFFFARAAMSCKIPVHSMLARREKETRQIVEFFRGK